MKISASKLHTLLIAGESAAIEYKRCGEGPKADTFESICAFPQVAAVKDATLNATINATLKATLNQISHVATNVATNVALNVAIKLSAQEQAVVRQIQKDVAVSQAEIAERLHLSRQHVNRVVRRLKSLNVIVREGSKKTGHWKIVKEVP